MPNRNNNLAIPENAPPKQKPNRRIRTALISRNITVEGRRTSVRLEPEMWHALKEISRRERANIHQICTSVSLRKQDDCSLTAAIRVYVMDYFRAAATEEGHTRAGHGYGMTLALSNNFIRNISPPKDSFAQQQKFA